MRVIVVYLPRIAAKIHDPGPWTSGFEVLAMGGAAWALAVFVRSGRGGTQQWSDPIDTITKMGRCLFAISMIVFGVQHLLYGQFVATLVPKWIPGQLFWAYFFGAAFIAAGIAIIIRKTGRLAAILLGVMFSLWVVTLHVPRVAAASHNPNEWTSALVALAMAGGSFLVAGTFTGDRHRF